MRKQFLVGSFKDPGFGNFVTKLWFEKSRAAPDLSASLRASSLTAAGTSGIGPGVATTVAMATLLLVFYSCQLSPFKAHPHLKVV